MKNHPNQKIEMKTITLIKSWPLGKGKISYTKVHMHQTYALLSAEAFCQILASFPCHFATAKRMSTYLL